VFLRSIYRGSSDSAAFEQVSPRVLDGPHEVTDRIDVIRYDVDQLKA
jgi:hypothetical protein